MDFSILDKVFCRTSLRVKLVCGRFAGERLRISHITILFAVNVAIANRLIIDHHHIKIVIKWGAAVGPFTLPTDCRAVWQMPVVRNAALVGANVLRLNYVMTSLWI